MSDQLTLAFVGCGAIAEMHLMGIGARAPAIRITAAVDPVAERAEAMAKRTGARPFASLDQALAAGGFEAVDLMLPHDLHEPLACAALAAGKHVLLEKPMATTVASCDRILAAARAAGTVFMVAENAQYWPEVVRAKELLDRGALGDVVSARATVTMPLMRGSPFYAGERPWRFDKAVTGGGISLDVGSHWIRPLRIWLGEIDEVVAALGHPAAEMEGESLVRALFRFRSGVCATFDAATIPDAVLGPDVLFRITGTHGEIVIESTMGGRLVLYDRENPKGLKEDAQGYLKSYGSELADFTSAVLHGTPLAAGPEQSIGELRTALAMYRSAETKRWEKVWD
jgi:UDP-N-acetyl-2-amino-2-deoxyglucuronate dehydrogenase